MRLLLALLFALVALPAAAQRAPDSFPGCVYNATPPTLADRQVVPWQCDINGNLLTTGGGGGSGTVTDVSVVSANGFAGSVATATTTPTITLSTTITGILSGNGTAISAASTTGSGAIVLANTPTLITPVLGVATATSINKVALTAPATSATLTIADGKTLTASNSLTLAGTDSTVMTFPSVSASIPGLAVANVFTRLQTITQGTANEGILASTGYSLTGSNAQNLIDIAGTLNTSGNPIALKIALTNTASGSTTKFVSFLAGASGTTAVYSIDKAGNVATTSNSLLMTGFSVTSNNVLLTTDAGGLYFGVANDLSLFRDAANTLAQRNSTSPQTLRVYNTFTDASNYERAVFDWSTVSNRLTIGPVAAGTGTLRSIGFTSHVLWNTDNTYDIGASGATRPRTLYVGTDIKAGNQIRASSEVLADQFLTSGSTGLIGWSGSSGMKSASNGVIALYNNATNDFNRLQFGGTTSSFPALKRSTTTLQVRLADDSADAGITAASISTSATNFMHITTAALADGAGAGAGTITNAPSAGNPTKWIPINDNGTTRYIPAW